MWSVLLRRLHWRESHVGPLDFFYFCGGFHHTRVKTSHIPQITFPAMPVVLTSEADRQHNSPEPIMPTLIDKFHGCIAGSWIGSAMGAPVEGWPRDKVVSTFGFVDKLLPYKHYIEYTDWLRPAGTTEDGIERQKLIATAIIEKQDRILAQDLAAIWARDLDPDKVMFKQEPYDRAMCLLIKNGVPAAEMGKMSIFLNVITMARASHPLGLINAGDPRSAADDTIEVGRLYMRELDFGLRWAALYNAAIAHACRPDATVASVLQTAVEFSKYRAETGPLYTGAKVDKFAYDTIARDVRRALDIAAQCTTREQLWDKFNAIYAGGHYLTYGLATAPEIVSKGLAIFALHKGDPVECILTAVNFARDTDCLAAIAGGLSGALAGASALKPEWIATVNDATRADPYTNNKRTIEETADGLFAAFLNRRKKLHEYLKTMDPENATKASADL
jgi:ADP-ribosylglycohydrolase